MPSNLFPSLSNTSSVGRLEIISAYFPSKGSPFLSKTSEDFIGFINLAKFPFNLFPFLSNKSFIGVIVTIGV